MGSHKVYSHFWVDPIVNLYALIKEKTSFPSCVSIHDFLVCHSVALPLSLTMYQTISKPKLQLILLAKLKIQASFAGGHLTARRQNGRCERNFECKRVSMYVKTSHISYRYITEVLTATLRSTLNLVEQPCNLFS